MTDRPARYSSRSHRPAGPSPEQIEASLAFQMPSAPEPEIEIPHQTAQTAPGRSELIGRVLTYSGDRWALYRLVLGTVGPDAFTDEALQTAVRIVEALGPREGAPDCPVSIRSE